MKIQILFLILFFTFLQLKAQTNVRSYSNLSRNISLKINNQPLGNVLENISRSGNFLFSYSGNAFKRDSIVSVSAQNKPVRKVLDELFRGQVEYKESGNYIILRSISGRFELMTENINSHKNFYEIEGFVLDAKTGKKVKDASVYEKKLVKSTLTDENGYFKLRFKGEHEGTVLTVSKDNFRDTSIMFLPDVAVQPQPFSEEATNEGAVLSFVEKLRLSRFLIGSRQRIQSLNIPAFLANSPFQASFLPGLSSQGIMSSQVVNKGSLNVLGGYTAGVNGVEIAGLFNITKQDVKKVQVAGLLNLVGGSVNAVQVAGLVNSVLDSVEGVQVAGLVNYVNHSADGAQVAGLLNLNQDKVKGVQVAGFANVLRQDIDGTQISGFANFNLQNFSGVQVTGFLNTSGKQAKGVQIAGFGNVAAKSMDGVQIAGFFNFAKRIKGIQIGLINIADTSSAYSIGLLNLVRKGYHKVSVSANEFAPYNLSLKTGNSKLYTMISAGGDFADSSRVIFGGLGLGHDFIFRKPFSLSLELQSHLVYLGDWSEINPLQRLQTSLQLQIIRGITLFSGPSYTISYHKPSASAPGYRKQIVPSSSRTIIRNTRSWMGWNIGLTFM